MNHGRIRLLLITVLHLFMLVFLDKAVAENGYTSFVKEAFRRADALRHQHEPARAAEIYQRLLSDPTLRREDNIRARFALAQTLETMPGQGKLAQQNYKELAVIYPDDPMGLEAAYRLGCLYHSILLPGTTRCVPKAVEQFEYILRHGGSNQMIALKAHMNLGNLYAEMQEFEKAQDHFRAIYDYDSTKVEDRGDISGLPSREELRRMQNRAAIHMVETCIYPDHTEAVIRLQALISRYPDDPHIARLAEEKRETVLSLLLTDDEGHDISSSVLDSIIPANMNSRAATIDKTRGETVKGLEARELPSRNSDAAKGVSAKQSSVVRSLWRPIIAVIGAVSLVVAVLLLAIKWRGAAPHSQRR